MSFTTDAWSDTSAGVSLLSLTCHAITSDFERMELVLGAQTLHERHTGEYISEIFDDMLVTWDISPSSVHAVMRDSGANMKKALFLSGVNNLDCTAHKLQLVVKSGLESQKSVTDLIAKVRSIGTHFHHSTMSQDELKKIQERLNAPKLSVVHDVPTRWNSTLHMMQRIIDLKESLCLFSDENSKIKQLTKADFDLLVKCVRILKPFDEITKRLSSSSTSISEVIPLIASLNHTLKARSPEEDHGVKTMIYIMLSELTRRFDRLEGNDNYGLATYLDPKFKSKFFSPVHVTRIKHRLGVLCDELMEAGSSQPAAKKSRVEQVTPVIEAGSSSQTEPGPSGVTLLHSSLTALRSSSSDDESESETSKTSTEIIENYHKEKRIGQGPKDNSLLWWKANQSKYHHLSILARSYLSCPPTSVPSERLFSGAGLIYDEKRNRLHGETAEKWLFLKYSLPYIN
jgi:hypothetical protein